jgi:hypothetical protein
MYINVEPLFQYLILRFSGSRGIALGRSVTALVSACAVLRAGTVDMTKIINHDGIMMGSSSEPTHDRPSPKLSWEVVNVERM